MNPVRLALAAGACLLAVLAGLAGLAATGNEDGTRAPRAAAAKPVAFTPARVTPAAKAERRRAARRLGRGARIETDRNTGGVRFAGRLDGFLTGPRTGDAADIALDYVRHRERVFGLDRRELAQLELADRRQSNGLTLLRWTQQVGGVPLLEGSLRAAVTDDGRLVNITGGAHPDLPRPGTPRLSKPEAIAIAARATQGRPGGKATLVMTAATGQVRLAYRVLRPQGHAYYDQLIDAETGAELARHDRVDHAVPGLVYDVYPNAPKGGTAREIDLEPYLHAGATELIGPRAHVWADLNANDSLDLGERIGKAGTGFKYTRGSFTLDPKCPVKVGCAWRHDSPRSWSTNQLQAGTQLFALLGQYADHLAGPAIGFDGFKEEIGGVGSDPVLGNVMDGANGPSALPDDEHLNNAGMFVPPEGNSPRLDAFLFYELDKYPALDPVDDASVVYHEYGHGLVGRTVVDSAGWGALNLLQPAALNEALADFFALDYLVGRNLMTDTAAPGEVWIGAHLFKPGVGRKMAIDCPVGAVHPNCVLGTENGGLTYREYGQVHTRPEEHYDGEIMGQTLWQLRERLLADHPWDLGRSRALAYKALQLSPPEPSFLDYRNALLQADQVLNEGEDRALIWQVFTEREMGWYASTLDSDDPDPEASDVPGPPAVTGRGTVSGIVTDRDSGAPLAGATVFLGGHRLPNGSFEATTDGDGRFRFTDVPVGTYPHLIARRTGYAEHAVRDVQVAGETRADVSIRRNWADTKAGAVIVGTTAPRHNGCRAGRLADGDRASSWGSQLTNGDEFSVDIALAQPVRVTSFGIDPTPHTTTAPGAEGGRCPLALGARATRVRILVAGDQGGPWRRVIDESIDDSHLFRMTELRPNAPIDDARFVRVEMVHPVDQRKRVLAFSEVQVYASAKRPPRAVFDYEPKPLDVGETATFNATASEPGDAQIVRWEWDLDGNGSFETDTLTSTATKAFAESGRYRVGVRVTDANGEQDEFRTTVLVARDVEIFDLGTTAPDDSGPAHSNAISRQGRAAITMGRSGETDQLPARYQGGSAQPLDLLPGHVMGAVWEVNDADQAVGSSYPVRQFGQVNAVLWNGTTPTPLGTLGGSSSTAVGLNANGWAVGWAYDAQEIPRGYLKRLGHPMVDVQVEAGLPPSARRPMKLVKINDNGVAVGCNGYTRAGEGCDHAVRYDGIGHTLTQLPDLGWGAGATDISPDGRLITGVMYDAGMIGRAAVWLDGQPQQLGLLGGHSQAVSVNSEGTVTGHLGQLRGFGAWMKRWNEPATMLDTLVPDTGWHLIEADGINDRDEIVGTGTIGGQTRGYQLNLGPCRVCVTDLVLQQRDLPGDNWQEVGPRGTVDGNLVRVQVHVANHDDQPHVFQVKARDETRKEQIDEAPTVSLDPGQDKWVELEWDTDGLAWKDGAPDSDHVLRVRATLGHTIYGGRSAVLKVRPRPLVLIPGALEDAAAWNGYRELVHRAHPDWEAYAVAGLDTGRWTDLAHAPDTLDRHSEVLESFVAGVRNEEDAGQVDLVAHGLGGLIARSWIQDGMDDGAARRLIQLGTPNEGTPCAEITGAEPFYDLRRDVMAGFNARVTDRRGVAFSAYAGDTEEYTCVRGTEGGDGAVPVSSARWTIEDSEPGPIEHTAMTSSGPLFTDFVKPRLDGTQAAEAGLRATAAAADAPDTTPRSHQLLAQRIETVPPGAGIDVPLDVDSGSQLDVALLAPPQVTAELLNPDGAVVDTAERGASRSLTAADPATGRWHVRLRSSAGAPVQVAVSAALRDDAWNLVLRRGRPGPDGALPLIAHITRFDRVVKDAAVTLEVQRRGAAPQTVTLLDDGNHHDGLPLDGCYGAAPKLDAGEARLRLRVVRAASVRLRATWADVPATGDGRRPSCPDAVGRNGEIAFDSYEGGLHHWGKVDPLGVEGPMNIDSDRIAEIRWSLDGERLAWGGRGELYVADADGSNPVRITEEGTWRDHPEWSPDGTKLAYTYGCNYVWQTECRVAILDLASRVETIVGAGAAPDWSPDGEHLVVVRSNDPEPILDTDLWTIRIEDGHAERITELSRVDDPVWSPTDDRIAFTRWDQHDRETEFGNDQEIYVVDADGGGVRNLTNDEDCEAGCRGDRRDEAPSWSPDGRWIAFVSTRGEQHDPDNPPTTTQVWEIRPDGTARRKRTSSPTWKIATAWRSVPWLESQAAPRCFDLDVIALRDSSVRIPLDCADDNGDHLTLRVTDEPEHGTLTPIGEDGSVRYTPAAGFTGTDEFVFDAADEHERSAPAHARITVSPPPPPPPPPTPPWRADGGVSGGGSGGGGHRDDDEDEGPRGPGRPQLPSDCLVLPGTSWCYVPVGCGPGGDISGCTGRWMQEPARARRGVAVVARARTPKLLKPVTLRIPAGQTRKLRLQLTKAGKAQLRKRGRVTVTVRGEIRAEGRVIKTTRQRFVFKRRR
jgi:uncharacterized membrane protein